jgi:hypothetical protein
MIGRHARGSAPTRSPFRQYSDGLLVLAFVAAFGLMSARAIAQSADLLSDHDDPGTGTSGLSRLNEGQVQGPAPPPVDAYVPISRTERVEWIVGGTVGPSSLAVGFVAAGLQPGFKLPRDWGWTWHGYGRRYAEREADVAISNTIEAGLGALWGEEPRYIPSGRHGAWPRTRYALKTVFLAQRSSGRLAPAWGRYAGNVFNNLIENTWLPRGVTTWDKTTLRSADGFFGRAAGNLWNEFWPDIRKRLKKRSRPEGTSPDRVSPPAEQTPASGPPIADRRPNRTP